MNKFLLGRISKDSARILVRSWGFKCLPRKGRENLVSRAIADHRPCESIVNDNGTYLHFEYERVIR